MSRGSNTQGSGGAGTGSGSGGSSGAGTGSGNGGAGSGSGRTKTALGLLLGVVVVGLALLAAPLVDRWADPTTRPALYLVALLAVYAACMHTVVRYGRRHT